MALKAKDKGIDHNGNKLPSDVYASTREDGSIAGYRVRWREEDKTALPGSRASHSQPGKRAPSIKP